MDGASGFKFGKQLEFAKAHHKITRKRKGGHGFGLGELSNIWGFPFNIYTMAESSDLKFGTQLGFAKTHHKITRRKGVSMALGSGRSPKFGGSSSIFTQWLKLATSNLVHSLGLARPTIKPHPEEKWASPWDMEASEYLGLSV